MIGARRYQEADALLGQLAAVLAREPEFHRLRAQAAKGMKEPLRAIEHLRAAIAAAPRVIRYREDLADLYRKTGRPADAVAELRQALALDPTAIKPRLGLARLLRQLGDRPSAIAELDRVVTAPGADADVLTEAAMLYVKLEAQSAAIRAMRKAAQARPGDFDVQTWLRKLYTDQVKPWHFPMMNDRLRAEAYEQALRRAVKPTTTVLEIGTGSGLLAMMAARAGARRVTTCETIEVIAEAASEIVRLNGLADRIAVIAKPSTALKVGIDLPERADLLVSEILSDAVLGEDVLRSTAHARAELLKPGAPMIPYAVAAVARLVGGRDLLESTRVETVAGFDLTPFNRFTPSVLAIKMDTRDFADFSADIEAFRFDLAQPPTAPEETRLAFEATRTGACVGVLQWVRLYLDAETIVENRPEGRFTPSAWRSVLFPFPAPRSVREGERIMIRAKHNLISLAFAEAP